MAFDIQQAKIPGFLRRLAAMLYDLVLLFGMLLLAVAVVVIPYVELIGPEFPHSHWLYRLYLLAIAGSFYVYFWVHGGQTLGMRAWRFCLVREDGRALTAADALKRLGWAALTIAPAGIGLFWMLADRERLTWYDRLSHTRPVMLSKP
jgi:uncharacterized RDD family membrane protein YckC